MLPQHDHIRSDVLMNQTLFQNLIVAIHKKISAMSRERYMDTDTIDK